MKFASSVLPIDVYDSNVRKVRVPCVFPEALTFGVVLPGRGFRMVSAYLFSTDPETARVGEVVLTEEESDPRLFLSDPYSVEPYEQTLMNKVARIVFTQFRRLLGLEDSGRAPALEPIARAYEAEQAADALQRLAYDALPSHMKAWVPGPLSTVATASKAADWLASYVGHLAGKVCAEQDERARAESEAHLSERPCERGGSDRATAALVLGSEP